MSTYTTEQKTAALELYKNHGTAHTSRETGIPTRTLIRWANKAQVTHETNIRKSSAGRAALATQVQTAWGDFRTDEADAAGATAQQLRSRLLIAADTTDAPLIKALATAYGILIDKAELLSDRATTRAEILSNVDLDVSLLALVTEFESNKLEAAASPVEA